MNFQNASKQQLEVIAFDETNTLDDRYAAAKELQARHIPEEIQGDIVYRLGVGISIQQIADENGLSLREVVNFVRSKFSKHKSVQSLKEMAW